MRYDTTLSGFSLLCNCQTRDILSLLMLKNLRIPTMGIPELRDA